MDLNQIAVFVRVIESGSFTKAAKYLKQPKSRVSRNIAALEKELGVSLLYRTTRQFSPTEAGRLLYQKCKDYIYGLEGAVQALQENSHEVSGTLKLTAAEDLGSVLLGPVISEISSIYPKLKIELFLSNEVIDLVKEGVDLAIRIGELEDTTLKARLLGKVSFILVASPEYLNRASEIATLSDMGVHPALVFATQEQDNRWTLRNGKKKEESIKIQAYCRSNNPKILLDLAIAGKGIALIPEFLCMDAIRHGLLNRVLNDYSTVPMPVSFVWPSQKETNPKIRAFIDLGLKRLAKYF